MTLWPRCAAFTAEDATVIVGTVIDEEMTDNLRVTVVATGLGAAVNRTPTEAVVASSRRVPIPFRWRWWTTNNWRHPRLCAAGIARRRWKPCVSPALSCSTSRPFCGSRRTDPRYGCNRKQGLRISCCDATMSSRS